MKNNELKEEKIRKIDLFYSGFQLGTFTDKDEKNLYTYNSNNKNEALVSIIGFLPSSYTEELLKSNNSKFNNMPSFFNNIVDRVKDEKDTLNDLKLEGEYSDFDILFALSQTNFKGENITFKPSTNENIQFENELNH